MSVDWRNFIAIFITGVILLSFAAVIPLYPQSITSQLQNNLNSGQLSKEDAYAQQGSLTWWNLAQKNTYEPLSSIINSAGMLTLALSIFYACFAVIYSLSQNKFIKEMDSPRKRVEKETFLERSLSKGERVQSQVEPVPKDANVGLVDTNQRLEKQKAKEDLRKEYGNGEPPTALWYLAPFLFGLIGGLVGYVGTKEQDKELAESLLIFGIIWTFLLGIIYWFFIGSLF
jgi:hypothetical protein